MTLIDSSPGRPFAGNANVFISRSIKIFSKAITIKYNISQLNFYNSTSILTITITEGETRSISAKKISRPRRKPGLERDRQG